MVGEMECMKGMDHQNQASKLTHAWSATNTTAGCIMTPKGLQVAMYAQMWIMRKPAWVFTTALLVTYCVQSTEQFDV